MCKFTLPAVLTALLILIACSGTTSTPERTPVAAPTAVQGQSPAPARTATLVKEATPEPTGSPRTAPTMTPRPTRAEAATPAIPKAREIAATPTPTATVEPPASVIIPLMLDDAETFASEVSDSELACMAGTADPERLVRIFSGFDEPTQEELNVILGCLQEETLLRRFLGGFVQDPAPLSPETGVCIRAGFEGIDLRSAMMAALLGNERNNMLVAGVFVTIACLNDEEWETAATVMDVDPGARETMLCLLEQIGGTEGMTAALEAGDEGSLTDLLLAATGCGLETERGPEPAAAPAPASPSTTLVITIAPIPADIPEYDRGDWKHWVDADGDCQDARQEVLVEESLDEVTFETDRQCRVEAGRWYGAFTGVYVEDPGDLDIDHLVPLKNAHLSGGWRWDAEMREEYANDLSDPDHLIAVTAGANRSKGAKGPEEWGPPDLDYWCQYATDWTEVKARWELTMTEYETDIVMDMLGTCENPPDLEIWEALETATGEHKPEPTAEPEASAYESCEEAESAGEERVQGSQGGGRGFPKAMVPSARDGDGDDVVCER